MCWVFHATSRLYIDGREEYRLAYPHFRVRLHLPASDENSAYRYKSAEVSLVDRLQIRMTQLIGSVLPHPRLEARREYHLSKKAELRAAQVDASHSAPTPQGGLCVSSPGKHYQPSLTATDTPCIEHSNDREPFADRCHPSAPPPRAAAP
jgi:hypothetical protein